MAVPVALNLQSSAFSDGFPIPVEHTGDGANASPPLRWDDPPAGTQSFAFICDDPDAPRGTATVSGVRGPDDPSHHR